MSFQSQIATVLHPSAGERRPIHAANTGNQAPSSPRLLTSWAMHLDEVREAQALRHQVFAAEMGATLKTSIPGHDIDLFDDFCEHLIIRDAETMRVVGTYRVLTPAQARRVGGTYTDEEFDLTRLRNIRERMVELGRSCVHPDHRTGGVILALWRELTQFMRRNGLDIMIGCATIPLGASVSSAGALGPQAAANIWAQMQRRHMAPVQFRVIPRLPLPLTAFDEGHDVSPPPLIKAYLRLGAKVMGPPAWDPEFNAADLPLIFHLDDMPARYQRQFNA